MTDATEEEKGTVAMLLACPGFDVCAGYAVIQGHLARSIIRGISLGCSFAMCDVLSLLLDVAYSCE